MNLNSFGKTIPRPSVIAIFGRRGSGKDVTACALAEVLHKTTKKPIFSNYNPKEFRLPKHWHFRLATFPKTIQLISDAHLEYFARDWQALPNKALIKMVSISRHNNIDFVWTSQLTTMLDRQMIANLDAIIFKQPSALAERFERSEIRDISLQAKGIFEDQPDQTAKWETAYAYTHTGEYTIKGIKKPAYFTENMSKVFGREAAKKGFWKRLF